MRQRTIRTIFQGSLAVLLASASVLVFLAASTNATSNRHNLRKGWCAPSRLVNVAKAPGEPRNWKVSVTYCQPYHWEKGGRQVDVLTHGATYTHAYWDWSQQPALYSYVDKTLASGRAVLNYDRIGNGKSTRPVSTEITMQTDGYVLHQLIHYMQRIGFRKVNSIGHSYGSGVAVAEAAAYHDVNSVVLTGYLHRTSNPAVTAGNYPANLDPAFQTAGLDGGYLTTRPNTRALSFYSSSADPNVVAYDEAHKDVVSLTGLLDFLGERNVTPATNNISNQITAPVLVVTGQQDAIFCFDQASFDCSDQNLVKSNEAPYYQNAARFASVTIPNTGHDLALHPSADTSFKVIDKWLRKQ